ncbi:MAG: S-layer homology domain-containing protein [Aphanocapsa sp. GSE-SYN-MK-11-07L]|jgi:hypothetical protein|nr:S-layer homology domain-containing protein [Aphanocapsa sp. GSE-SYN-MK-11-07L]
MKKLSALFSNPGFITGSLVAAIAPFTIAAPALAASFTDMRGHWVKPFFERLANANVIAGFPDNIFRPEQPVTRAVINQGTRIQLRYPDKPEASIIMISGETVEMTLIVPASVVNAQGETILPAGARLQGRFTPVQVDGVSGTRFVGDKLLLTGTYPLSAVSGVRQASSSQNLQTGTIQAGIVTPAAQNVLQARANSNSNSGTIGNNTLGNLAVDIVQSVISPSGNRANSTSNSTSNSASVVVFSPEDLTVTVQTPITLDSSSFNRSQ